MKIFKIDLILEAEAGANETMPEVRKLQNLYRAIPEDNVVCVKSEKDVKVSSRLAKNKNVEKIMECRKILDSVSSQIHERMLSNQELLTHLFKRMAFYYEMKAFTKDGPLIQEQSGVVEVIKFEYEAFSVGVRVSSKKGISDEYIIPEGFTVWVEISMKAKDDIPMSLF